MFGDRQGLKLKNQPRKTNPTLFAGEVAPGMVGTNAAIANWAGVVLPFLIMGGVVVSPFLQAHGNSIC